MSRDLLCSIQPSYSRTPFLYLVELFLMASPKSRGFFVNKHSHFGFRPGFISPSCINSYALPVRRLLSFYAVTLSFRGAFAGGTFNIIGVFDLTRSLSPARALRNAGKNVGLCHCFGVFGSFGFCCSHA